jgi:hypothetical protein
VFASGYFEVQTGIVRDTFVYTIFSTLLESLEVYLLLAFSAAGRDSATVGYL